MRFSPPLIELKHDFHTTQLLHVTLICDHSRETLDHVPSYLTPKSHHLKRPLDSKFQLQSRSWLQRRSPRAQDGACDRPFINRTPKSHYPRVRLSRSICNYGEFRFPDFQQSTSLCPRASRPKTSSSNGPIISYVFPGPVLLYRTDFEP